jgi:DNA invertase Pin-like site-specific DNA recombinase
MAQQPPIPVAQYVRTSTEDQQYSIANQKAAIERSVIQNGFHITRTFADLEEVD